MRDEIGAVTVGLGAAAEQVAVMTPVLRRSLEESIRRMEDAIARGRYARPYDDRYERRYDPRDDRYDRRDGERYEPQGDERYESEDDPR